ncbi:MAG: hypothetical protein H2049_06070 [Porphyrobacter sp.]|nr:hypothetical protein [Porphyrobacter sp.]
MIELNEAEVRGVQGAGLLGAVIGAAIGSAAGPGGVIAGAVVGHYAEEAIRELTAE